MTSSSETLEEVAGQSPLEPPSILTSATMAFPHLGVKGAASVVTITQTETENRLSPFAVGAEDVHAGSRTQEQQQQQQHQEGNAGEGASSEAGQSHSQHMQREQQQPQGGYQSQSRGKPSKGVTMPSTSQNNRRAPPPMPMPPMPMQLIQPSTHFQFPLGASLANM